MTALRAVNFFYKGIKGGTVAFLYVRYEYGSANSVPSAAVIWRVRALSGSVGFKGIVDGLLM